MFDCGAKKNKVRYGKSVPPPPCNYLNKTTVPTYIYNGRGDNVVPYEVINNKFRN